MKQLYKPVSVPAGVDSDVADKMYGSHYGVDWVYELPTRKRSKLEWTSSNLRYKTDNPYHYGTPEWQACEDYNAGYNDALRDTLRERKVTQCPCATGDM